jgi:7-cyano-7-deazaguanine synthase
LTGLLAGGKVRSRGACWGPRTNEGDMALTADYPQQHVLVLASGGIDSTLCIHHLVRDGYPVRAMHIEFGQPASEREWESVERIGRKLGIESTQVGMSPIRSAGNPEIVGRNAALICIALLHARANEKLICIGVHAGTPFFDCSPSFVETMGRLVAEQTDSRVRLLAPLVALTKPEIVARARGFGISLVDTYSCQLGTVPPCGRCHSCRDRIALGC